MSAVGFCLRLLIQAYLAAHQFYIRYICNSEFDVATTWGRVIRLARLAPASPGLTSGRVKAPRESTAPVKSVSEGSLIKGESLSPPTSTGLESADSYYNLFWILQTGGRPACKIQKRQNHHNTKYHTGFCALWSVKRWKWNEWGFMPPLCAYRINGPRIIQRWRNVQNKAYSS